MDLKEFDYVLPESLIAAVPSRRREGSRLLVLQRSSGEIAHTVFRSSAIFLVPEISWF